MFFSPSVHTLSFEVSLSLIDRFVISASLHYIWTTNGQTTWYRFLPQNSNGLPRSFFSISWDEIVFFSREALTVFWNGVPHGKVTLAAGEMDSSPCRHQFTIQAWDKAQTRKRIIFFFVQVRWFACLEWTTRVTRKTARFDNRSSPGRFIDCGVWSTQPEQSSTVVFILVRISVADAIPRFCYNSVAGKS